MEHSAGGVCDICGLVPLAPRLRGASQIVACSPAMQDVLKRTARFASSHVPVAILGETGTGKDIIARIIHANSPRAKQPFVAVNVAALPSELLESELFGHVKGAFTGAASAHRGLFEAAHGGTLFLDEIGEMPLPLQAKLLRALQDGEIRRVGETRSFTVDVRVVSATHRDMARLVREGHLRQDLFYRLRVLTLEIPPLRARPADVLPLAGHFLAEEETKARDFSARARDRLLRYSWPGNVRELQNVVKHGAALATGALIEEDDLPDDLARGPANSALTATPEPQTLRTLAEVERGHIMAVLDACGGSQSEAARALGIAR
ncbi:MAG: sigma-54 dependent transcriptional regulator, partial [Vicinamibacteria bacterium]